MITREALEEREQETLAPYAMKSADSRGRDYPEDEHSYRTAFQRDRDRIVHSTAFRRLEYKTQVFINHEGDYYRTRLTHTMEVVQICRSVARALGLNEDLVESVALAHDLGHTPFGHSGEDALSELMAGHGGFEHNAQSLRIIEVLEERYPNFHGLNLTYEVRECVIKHQTKYDNPRAEKFNPQEGALLESLVVDACDSIAYDNHDIDDGLKSGFLKLSRLMEVPLFSETWQAVQERFPGIETKLAVRQTVLHLIDLTVTNLIQHSLEAIRAQQVKSVEDVRNATEPLICFSPKLKERRNQMEDFLYENLYRHYRVARMQQKAQRFVKELFEEYVRYPLQLPPKYQEHAEQDCIQRAVCDYIAGMTDRYAQEEYQKIFLPFERI